MDSKLKNVLEVLKEALKTDEGYRVGWQASIAMAFKDEYYRSENKEEIHEIANRASDNFLDMLCQ